MFREYTGLLVRQMKQGIKFILKLKVANLRLLICWNWRTEWLRAVAHRVQKVVRPKISGWDDCTGCLLAVFPWTPGWIFISRMCRHHIRRVDGADVLTTAFGTAAGEHLHVQLHYRLMSLIQCAQRRRNLLPILTDVVNSEMEMWNLCWPHSRPVLRRKSWRMRRSFKHIVDHSRAGASMILLDRHGGDIFQCKRYPSSVPRELVSTPGVYCALDPSRTFVMHNTATNIFSNT